MDDITFLQADVLDLPAGEGQLSPGSFDHVFAFFLLEPSPTP